MNDYLRSERSIVSEPSESGPDFAKGGGLLPAIAQDADDGTVLIEKVDFAV